jgi:dTDP-4-amino-4,6-dideoxygalactose transaminase
MTESETKSKTFVPFARPDTGADEMREIASVINSGWLTTGSKTAQFQREFAEYCRARHALAVNSGTAGLHLALAGLGIGPGDEVITTPLTFCATINVILEVGATPVLADIDCDLNIDPECIVRSITPATKAILPVHIGGLPCRMDAIWETAKRHGCRVIEDAAHASGSSYQGVPIGGGISDAVVFSFYVTKNLCTGEGGMVTTPSEELHERMRILCLHGISCDAWNRYTEKGNWYYEVVERGFKYNMSDIMAALGVVQLRRLDAMNLRRAGIATRYNEGFGDIAEVELPPGRSDRGHAWHLYVIRLNLERLTIDRRQFIEEMRARGIGCSVHFIPIPLHPYYQRTLETRDPCWRALAEYPRLVSLPLYSKMSDGEVERVIAAVRDIAGRHARRRVRVNRAERVAEMVD